jgi:hypothetical protein
MVERSGRSSLGCLLSLLLVAVAVYVGVNLFEVYWRYFEFRDAMRQEVRFGAQITDEKMKVHLAALADSMGLPDEAGHVTVVRTGQTVSVSADYVERVVFPMYSRTIHFRPSATGTY